MPRTKRVRTTDTANPAETFERRILPAPTSSMSQDERAWYAIHSQRQIVPSRYLDEHTVQRLHWTEAVKGYLEAVGWTRFIQLRYDSYSSITFEFLSTLEVDINVRNLDEEGQMKFALDGKRFSLSMAQVLDLLSLPHDGARAYPTAKRWKQEAWETFTEQPRYSSRNAKASFIKFPAIRYLHRVMSNSVFGRGESTGSVSLAELFMLWSMYTKTPVCSGIWIMNHLAFVAKAKVGKIVVGGIITALARALKIKNLGTPVVGLKSIDMDTLMAMKMVDTHTNEGEYVLLTAQPRSREIRGVEEQESEEEESEEERAEASTSHPSASMESIEALLRQISVNQTWTNERLESLTQIQDSQRNILRGLMEDVHALWDDMKRRNEANEAAAAEPPAGPSSAP